MLQSGTHTTQIGRSMKSAGVALVGDHAHVQGLILRLKAYINDGDVVALYPAWKELEELVLSHMDAEEEHFLPGFTRANPEGGKSLLRDHLAIRQMVDDLGLEVELHHVRKPDFDPLLALLGTHALLEQDILYPWVDKNIDHSLISSVLGRFRHRAHEAKG